MAYLYTEVDVSKLEKAITELKNELKTDYIEEVLKDLSNSQNFQTNAINPLKNALETLIKTRYKELENMLDQCSKLKNYIASYNEKKEKIKSCEESISQEQKKDHPKGSKIRSLRNEIKKLKSEMTEIVSNVKDLG